MSATLGRARTLVLAGAAALLVVLLLTLVHAPTPVRALFCLPLLVGICGAALAATLVPDQDRLEPLVRVGLALLLGLTALAFSGLLTAVVLRRGVSPDPLVGVHLAVTAAALGVWYLRAAARTPGRWSLASPVGALPGSTVVSAVVGVALLVSAVVAGRALLPTSGAAPTFSFTGPAATSPGPTVVAPGGSVQLPWVVRHAGSVPAGQPLEAVIDGRPVGVASDVTPAATGDYTGSARLVAPTDPGLHRVVLSVPLPTQRLELVTYLDVRRP